MTNILEVKNLSKSFKKNFYSPTQTVLKNLSFSLPKGSVTGFLGANGAGKTSTFKCLLGFLKRDQGQITFFNESKLTPEIQAKIGFLPERPYFQEDLNSEELLCFYSKLTQPKLSLSVIKKRVEHLLKQVDLYRFRNQRLRSFSKGMLQKIGLLQAYVSDPQFIILDEPFSGLDPEGRFHLISLIERMQQEGKTVFFSSHILQDVERLCDRLIVLKEGENIFEGSFSHLRGGGEGARRILFLNKDQKEQVSVSTLAECQKKIQQLVQEKKVILSVQVECFNLESFYTKLILNKKRK